MPISAPSSMPISAPEEELSLKPNSVEQQPLSSSSSSGVVTPPVLPPVSDDDDEKKVASLPDENPEAFKVIVQAVQETLGSTIATQVEEHIGDVRTLLQGKLDALPNAAKKARGAFRDSKPIGNVLRYVLTIALTGFDRRGSRIGNPGVSSGSQSCLGEPERGVGRSAQGEVGD